MGDGHCVRIMPVTLGELCQAFYAHAVDLVAVECGGGVPQ